MAILTSIVPQKCRRTGVRPLRTPDLLETGPSHHPSLSTCSWCTGVSECLALSKIPVPKDCSIGGYGSRETLIPPLPLLRDVGGGTGVVVVWWWWYAPSIFPTRPPSLHTLFH